ncbi:MAG TPA: DUF2442 domain-containing protein [Thermoanaerobaculia bacterium]|jgi:hypothetical protein
MPKAVEVKALSDYRIWIRFDEGIAGEVDLSHLAGRGVFSLWQDYTAFQGVHLGPSGQIAWNDEVELCPDSLCLKQEDLRANWQRAINLEPPGRIDPLR